MDFNLVTIGLNKPIYSYREHVLVHCHFSGHWMGFFAIGLLTEASRVVSWHFCTYNDGESIKHFFLETHFWNNFRVVDIFENIFWIVGTRNFFTMSWHSFVQNWRTRTQQWLASLTTRSDFTRTQTIFIFNLFRFKIIISIFYLHFRGLYFYLHIISILMIIAVPKLLRKRREDETKAKIQ